MSMATLVYGDDWEGLYANGTLVTEGHSVTAREALNAFKNSHIEEVDSFEVQADWMYDQGRLPFNLHEIPQEARIS